MKSHIRNYYPGDDYQIVDLMESETELGGSSKFDLDFWEWKYKTNPWINSPIQGLVAEDEGIVGYLGVHPRNVLSNNQTIGTATLTDAVVRKSHRRQGIFKKLLNGHKHQAQKENAKLVITTPPFGTTAFHTQTSLDFNPIFVFSEMAKIIKPRNAARKYSKNIWLYYLLYPIFALISLIGRVDKNYNLSENFNLAETSIFDKRFDRFDSRSNSDFIFEANSVFLEWRYSSKSGRSYKTFIIEDQDDNLLGYIIIGLKRYSSMNNLLIGNIMDIRCVSGKMEIANSLLSHSIDYIIKEGADLIRCYVPVKHPYYKILRNRGFITFRKFPFLAFVNEGSWGGISKIKDGIWHFMLGDTDHA